jgi:hypothetical protein
VDANCPFNFNFLIGALASIKVDANEELLASTYIVDADSPILASTRVDANDGISASTLTVDANNPLILFFFNFFIRALFKPHYLFSIF